MARTVAIAAAVLLLCPLIAAQSGPELAVSTPPLPEAPPSHLQSSSGPSHTSWVETQTTSDYVPLTSHEKFEVFVHRTYSPWSFVDAGWDAAVSQATSGHEEYGQGMQGYGKRFGASMADNESGVLFGYYLLPTIFHQDPRYFRRPDLPFIQRGLYAASRVFLTRTDSGGIAPNVSYLGGSLAASAIANSYYPFNERGVGNTLVRFASGILSDAGMNTWHEFWPDIKAKLTHNRAFHHLEQTKVGQKVEQKAEQVSK